MNKEDREKLKPESNMNSEEKTAKGNCKSEKEEKITSDKMVQILDKIYEQVYNGIPGVSLNVKELAEDYLRKNQNPQAAAISMQNHQIIKCAADGFIAGFGGVITLPIALPANITSVLYVQMRMIACTAYMAGYNLKSDQVQTFVYACLAGISVNNVLKKFGVEFGKKVAVKAIEKIPGKVLVKINQKIGFRFVTKFGEKGMVNLAKLVPGVGAFVGGGLDFAETKVIADRAYKMFMLNPLNQKGKSEKSIIKETDVEEAEIFSENSEA